MNLGDASKPVPGLGKEVAGEGTIPPGTYRIIREVIDKDGRVIGQPVSAPLTLFPGDSVQITLRAEAGARLDTPLDVTTLLDEIRELAQEVVRDAHDEPAG